MLTLKGALDTGPKWVGSGRRLRGVPIGERCPLVLKGVAAEVHRLRGKIRDASCQGGQPPICWVVTAATTWTRVCAGVCSTVAGFQFWLVWHKIPGIQ